MKYTAIVLAKHWSVRAYTINAVSKRNAIDKARNKKFINEEVLDIGDDLEVEVHGVKQEGK